MQVRDNLGTALRRAQANAGGVAGAFTDAGLWIGLAERALHIALIIGLALALLGLVGRVRRRALRAVEGLPALDVRRQRTLTLGGLAVSTARYVVWLVVSIMVLAELGLDVGPLLAGAGVAGLAIGFGAQTLVKDVISGVFLLFDGTIRVGDTVSFGGQTGVVEFIGLRLIKVRKFDGELLMVPAGELRTFGNRSVGYVRVLIEIAVPYGHDLDAVLDVLAAAGQEWRAEEAHAAVALDDTPEVQAVTTVGAAALARLSIRVMPGAQAVAEDDLRRRVNRRLAAHGMALTVAPPAPPAPAVPSPLSPPAPASDPFSAG